MKKGTEIKKKVAIILKEPVKYSAFQVFCRNMLYVLNRIDNNLNTAIDAVR